ncbi:MAG: DMT family transporter [Oligoflexia bacterium]|nr:DMT family transporter [Oligoflexia bacterium]
MLITMIIPLFIGALGVLQNTINRKIALDLGIPLAIFINCVVLLICGSILLIGMHYIPESSVPDIMKAKFDLRHLKLHNLLPGIMGFLIIVIAPLAISKIGAARVFIGIIVAQIFVSIFWDMYYESITFDWKRWAGAILTIIGAILATR